MVGKNLEIRTINFNNTYDEVKPYALVTASAQVIPEGILATDHQIKPSFQREAAVSFPYVISKIGFQVLIERQLYRSILHQCFPGSYKTTSSGFGLDFIGLRPVYDIFK